MRTSSHPRLIALRETWEAKLRYIQIRNDLEFALRHPEIVEAAASNDRLVCR